MVNNVQGLKATNRLLPFKVTARGTMDQVAGIMSYDVGVILVAVVSVVAILVATVVVFSCGRTSKKQQSSSANLGNEPHAHNGSHNGPPNSGSTKVAKLKGLKSRQYKKLNPPPHHLLSADFKGHTGSVLSLDFELGGKYLASCSNG